VARPKLAVDLPSLGLVSSFTDRQAGAAGLTRALRDRMVEDGALIRFSRGLYRRTDIGAADLDLIEAALRSPLATICLTSALALHELTDEIPAALDLALPRRKWHPAGPVVAQWHSFDPGTFDIGRYPFEVDPGVFIGCYNAERSIIDAFHTRGLTGTDVAVEALKRWLRRPGSQPAQLVDLATSWPRALAPLRRALEVLL